LLQYAARYPDAVALLLDAYRSDAPGGTGETFDWRLVPARRSFRIVLSGGLNPDNVAAGIEQLRPWAVDVASGVETAPGLKDGQLVKRFAAAVRRVDERLGGGDQGKDD
jgi:phosphoribosylanthranilate isomerase